MEVLEYFCRKHFYACKGGDETRSGYVQNVQGNQPNVPARTTCRHGLYNSMVRARTSRCVLTSQYVLGQNCIEQTPLNIQF